MVICMLTAIRLLLSNRYKLITNVRSSLMAVNIHITIIELNALHTKRQNLFQELDAVIHLLMEAKHWGLRKSRNATSLNSRFKSLDTDRKSGSAGMPRPISYAVFCLKKKKRKDSVVQCIEVIIDAWTCWDGCGEYDGDDGA